MKIGIDIDDTICDTWQCVIPYISKYYNIDISYLNNLNKLYEDAVNISLNEYCIFAKKYYGLIIPSVPLKKDVNKVLNKFKELGYEIIFITARSTLGFDDPYKISYDYLIKNNVPFDKLIVGEKDKGKVCKDEHIDIFIDDSVDNCKNVSSYGIKVLLFETISNKDIKEFTKVKNWKQIEKIIEKR